jgi:protein-L-isoaspartate(D-aspartate) O-methyltransferase
MIALLRERGITDQRVIRAMGAIERHLFVQSALVLKSYDDCALPIGCGQTISQPYTVAFMTQSLNVQKRHKVLEIGTGSGYQAAILAELGARVFTIERLFELHEAAKKTLTKLHYHVATKVGDGTIGWNEFAPFDRIIVTAGAPEIPDALVKQLTSEGGKLVIPVGDMDIQQLAIITRNGDSYRKEEIDGFKFVPLIGKQGWSPA